MIIHGGYWREKYRADLGLPLAQDLAQRGIPAYNLEYRRGPGSAAKMLADARLALGLIKEEGPITLIGHPLEPSWLAYWLRVILGCRR
ncbi:hypothetical protein [Glutamicibacter sp. M10]|uniref:hypothetical protein n=1 Tax=Glutamicibacter sp. M10 TaxID=3023076 RepID=UPI0021C7C137|nr:hypothetical protein [Glutamicibacter sp. M10]UXN32380.1 hypothetical protein N6V40_02525 [Glutamicibacter sp. M10]